MRGTGSQPDARPGTYILILQLISSRPIEAGAMGRLELTSGWYAYVGSAFGTGGVAARCRHHRRVSDRPHWHVDYLRRVAELKEIWFTHDAERREHQWAATLALSRGARIPFPGFGATDCGCLSHLLYFSNPPSFKGFRRRLQQEIPLHAPISRELIDLEAI